MQGSTGYGYHPIGAAQLLDQIGINQSAPTGNDLQRLLHGDTKKGTDDKSILQLLSKAKSLRQFALVKTIHSYMRKELAAMPGMAVNDKRGYELLKSMCDALSPCNREEDVRQTCMKLRT